MANNKAAFVKELCDFYVAEVNPDFGIDDMDYVIDGDNEYVYVVFRSGSRKRFCVNGDSNQGILVDFCKFFSDHDKYPWIF